MNNKILLGLRLDRGFSIIMYNVAFRFIFHRCKYTKYNKIMRVENDFMVALAKVTKNERNKKRSSMNINAIIFGISDSN